MRGEAFQEREKSWNGRITPACAGRRQTNVCIGGDIQDHPRVCGEKAAWAFRSRCVLGSPPRVRGEGIFSPVSDGSCRITPACAGRRSERPASAAASTDHPRVCGEKVLLCPPPSSGTGSPPRVRGEDCARLIRKPKLRITPACAGRSPVRVVCRPIQQDHPRVCGEKIPVEFFCVPLCGSPPRVRGEAQSTADGVKTRGITPACAGRSTPFKQ